MSTLISNATAEILSLSPYPSYADIEGKPRRCERYPARDLLRGFTQPPFGLAIVSAQVSS